MSPLIATSKFHLAERSLRRFSLTSCSFVNAREKEQRPSEEWRSGFKKATHDVETTIEPLFRGWLQISRDGTFLLALRPSLEANRL